MSINKSVKKTKLAKHGTRTKWAPFWAVVRKFGSGKRVHPSKMTRLKRNWRQVKLNIRPKIIRKRHLG